jgi:DNA-binding protein YbaB
MNMKLLTLAVRFAFMAYNVIVAIALSARYCQEGRYYSASRQVNAGRYRPPTATCRRRSSLLAIPLFNWFQRSEQSPEGVKIPKFNSQRGEPDDEELMHRTVKMMENHRRSQEAAERTATMMEELSNSVVTGKSKAGSGAILGGSGVKVTFDGASRPISVEVDPKFLFSSSESGVIAVDDLNAAITEAMLDGYQQSSKLMEEKLRILYDQLGLPKDEGGK